MAAVTAVLCTLISQMVLELTAKSFGYDKYMKQNPKSQLALKWISDQTNSRNFELSAQTHEK